MTAVLPNRMTRCKAGPLHLSPVPSLSSNTSAMLPYLTNSVLTFCNQVPVCLFLCFHPSQNPRPQTSPCTAAGGLRYQQG